MFETWVPDSMDADERTSGVRFFTRFHRSLLRKLAKLCAVGVGVSLCGFLVLFVRGFVFFTAKESEVPWFYPLVLVKTWTFLLSAFGLIYIGVIVWLRRIRNIDHN